MKNFRTTTFIYKLFLTTVVLFSSCVEREDGYGNEAELSFTLDGKVFELSPSPFSDVPVVSGVFYNLGEAFYVSVFNKVLNNDNELSNLLLDIVIGANEGFRLDYKYDIFSNTISPGRPSYVEIGNFNVESGWIEFTSFDESEDGSSCVLGGKFVLNVYDPVTDTRYEINDGVFNNQTLDYYDNSVIITELS